jgi:hypothetical protein
MTYRVHRLDLKMTKDVKKLESYLNELEGDVVAIVPNVSIWAFWIHRVDFLLVVERLAGK